MNKLGLVSVLVVIKFLCFGQKDFKPCIYPQNKIEELPEMFLDIPSTFYASKRVDAAYSTGGLNGKCAIEYHGNSTRVAAKRSYDLEFRTPGGLETSQRILGLPYCTGIILLANVFDPSMLRNALAFDLWDQLGNTSAEYTFCNLYVDSAYQGVYMVTEKIRTVDRLIDESQWKSHPDLKDPFFMKIDWENEGSVRIVGLYDWPLQAKVYDPKPYTNKWIGYNKELETYFEKVNRSLNSIISDDKKNIHYSETINENSFVDYFLVSELTKNPDAYHSSVFFFSSLDGKLTMGPIWDFDLAFANRMNPSDDEVEGWIYKKEWTYKELRTMPAWWHLLMCDSAFRTACLNRLALIEQWIYSDDFKRNLSNHIEHLRNDLVKDAERWGTGTDLFVPGPLRLSIDEEVRTMCQFLEQRLRWMKEALPNEPCLSPFEVTARQENYVVVPMDAVKRQFTVKFDNDLTASILAGGSRFQYFSSYSYELFDSYGKLVGKGPVTGRELVIDASSLSKGNYYLIVSEHSSDDLLATSAPRMPTIYHRKLVVSN